MILKDGLCLNRACHCNGEKVFSAVGIHHTPWNKGIPPSEETRKKISKAHNGHPAWNKGVPRSEEAKQKLSEAHKGIPRSEETKHKISISKKGQSPWNKGIPRSEETKQKISRNSSKRINISFGDNTFDSLTEASKYYNVSIGTISYWLKTKKHNAFYIEKCPKI